MTLNPFLSIWIQPRTTVRMITIERPSFFVWPLAILAGINDSFHRAANSRSDPPPWPTVVALALIIGALWGPFSVWLGAYLLRWTGQWMGGTASPRRLRTALAWAAVPSLLGLLLWVPRLLVFGTGALTGRQLQHGGPSTDLALFGVLSMVDLVLAIWSLVLLCNTVAEVQGFRSASQGLANLILVGLVVAVPIIASIIVVLVVSR